MSSRTAFALLPPLLFLLFAGSLSAQDWEAFAASTDRSMDPFILQTMAAGDLETSIALCRGLGRRSDANVQAVIDSLAAGHVSRTSLGTEVLLRWLLKSAMDANSQEASLGAWLAANSSSVDMLLDRIAEWKNPQLKGALVRLAVVARSPQGTRAIMEVGASVVLELEHSGGLIPSEDAALALDFLSAAQRSARSDYFTYCTEIARLSRDAILVKAARSAAAALAAAQ
jgi:hypothetical protein